MKLALLLLAGLLGIAGCTDLQRSAYRDSSSINKYSRRNMMATARDIPLAPIHPRRVATYAADTPSSPAASRYAGRPTILTSEVVAPAYSPGLYGPVPDPQYTSMGSGFGGPRYRYASRNWGYGYYPVYGWGY